MTNSSKNERTEAAILKLCGAWRKVNASTDITDRVTATLVFCRIQRLSTDLMFSRYFDAEMRKSRVEHPA